MVLNRAKLWLCFTLFFSLAACQNNPTDTATVATETAIPTSSVEETPLQIAIEQTNEDVDAPDSEEPAQEGRTVNGRIITSDAQPVPVVQLRLAPGEPPVTETLGDGRFTLRDLPFTAVTIFADYFQFTIPAGEEPLLDLGDVEYPLIDTPFTLENYPPSETPYRFGGFWLVHTPDGQLIAFSPVSPEYDDRVSVEECQFAWEEANQRFVDPCSGDEWELNGRLNLEQSSERWSNRNLDQFFVRVTDGQIFVQIDRLYQSLPTNEPPVTSDSQFGVTMTVKTAAFTPNATSLTTLTQVDPIWGMDPLAFPPQQALTYVTFPNSLVDDQGRFYEPSGGQGGLAVTDANTNGLQQEYNIQWQPPADDAQTITATLTTQLNNLYRQIAFQPAWENHQEGDVWAVDMPLEIGHAVARVTQLEWLGTADDGRIRLRLTVLDDSPDGLALQCLYLSHTPPASPACANFSGQQRFVVFVPPAAPATLHVRAAVDLERPFSLTMPTQPLTAGAPAVPDLAAWTDYDDPALGLSFRYPPDWSVTQRGNGLTLTAPQTAVVDAEAVPWTIWISERPKFADDASLFDVIVNEYHFPDVIEQFEETLTEETVNGRTVYRSTIIPAQGGQVSMFFEDGDRFVEVALRPFAEERPYENQATFTQIFDTLLGTVTFLSAGG